MVGAIGFEPTTLWSQTRCATRLRYAPKLAILSARMHPLAVAVRQAVLMALVALLTAGALAPSPAHAQALHPAWDGEWIATETTQGSPGASLRIARRAAQTQLVQLVQAGQACALVYDGMAEPAALARRIQALQAWQLDARHWPAGTLPQQLVGLRHEFDTALSIVGSLPGPRYRITRIRGEGCDDADDIFFVLHPAQRLMRLRFPSASLGVDVTVFQKRSPP